MREGNHFICKTPMKRIERRIRRSLDARRREGRLRSLEAPVLQSSRLIDFASNDYLGIARDADINESHHRAELSSCRGSGNQLNGSTGSRLLTGASRDQNSFEEWLADFHGYEACVLFPSGYSANAGVAGCVACESDIVFFDQLSHNSTRFGLKSGRQRATIPFAHNDCDDLRQKLRSNRREPDATEKDSGAAFVFVEGVYSMDGDRAPLSELANVCVEEGACLVVDEAHSTGVLGDRGRGAVFESVDAARRKDAILCSIHTFGKAVGCHGAAVLCSSSLLGDYLANYSQPLIYATALSPASVRLAHRCYQELSSQDDIRRKRLRDVVSKLRESLTELVADRTDVRLIESSSAIHALVVPGADRVKAVADDARRAGFDIGAIRSPTVRAGSERLRIVAHSHNTVQQVRDLCDVLTLSLDANL